MAHGCNDCGEPCLDMARCPDLRRVADRCPLRCQSGDGRVGDGVHGRPSDAWHRAVACRTTREWNSRATVAAPGFVRRNSNSVVEVRLDWWPAHLRGSCSCSAGAVLPGRNCAAASGPCTTVGTRRRDSRPQRFERLRCRHSISDGDTPCDCNSAAVERRSSPDAVELAVCA